MHRRPLAGAKSAREAEDAERRGAFVAGVKGRMKKAEEGDVRKRKRDLVSPIKENVVKVIEHCSEAIKQLQHSSPREVHHAVSQFSHHLEQAWHNLRLLRRHFEDEEREAVTEMIALVENIRKNIARNIHKKVPRRVDKNWHNTVDPVVKAIEEVRRDSGVLFKQLEKLHR